MIGVRNMKSFSNIRSLLNGLASALNLINPELEYHHQKTAYLAFFIGREMGLSGDRLNLALYSAIFHDIGFIRGNVKISEGNAKAYAAIGADMLSTLPELSRVAEVVRYSHHTYIEGEWCAEQHPSPEHHAVAELAYIVHLADYISRNIRSDKPVLNQVKPLLEGIRRERGREFSPETVDALGRIAQMEFVWMDIAHDPSFLRIFTGNIRDISLEETVRLTRVAAMVIDYRSAFTAMHSAGVTASASILARLAGMSEADCMKMEIAGNLHDLGKLAVPNAILEKPGKLTEEEFNIVKEHPYYTRLILSKIDGFRGIAAWAGCHHEKLNGKGYPFRLAGDQLDLGTRVLTVADIFSAIAEERPYRKGMSKRQTMGVLSDGVKNGEIDGDIVSLLGAHYDEVDSARDALSHIAGRRYFESIGGGAT